MIKFSVYVCILEVIHLVVCTVISACRHGAVEFSAGVVELARVLGKDPRISMEVWHKER